MIKKEVLDVLCCPFCRANLKLDNNNLICANKDCGCIYQIAEDIPLMLIDDAKRPCPKCGQQREYKPEQKLLNCPQCSLEYRGK